MNPEETEFLGFFNPVPDDTMSYHSKLKEMAYAKQGNYEWKANYLKVRKLCEKKKFPVTRNIFYSHNVFLETITG